MTQVLAISGSLRAISYNSAALRAARRLAPRGMVVDIYGEMAQLPHFNPDLEEEPLPARVRALRDQVGAADALLIACPEYAHGIPGAFKNLLDWLVGSTEFPGKAVALFNCSPRASDAQSALRNVLTTMSARLVEDASIDLPLLGSGLGEDGIVRDPEMAPRIRAVLDKLAALA